MSNQVKVLFCETDSIYKELNCDVYDIKRNALNCKTKVACIYHPPCRSWGRLRTFCGLHPGEHLLAVWSIIRIWRYGGVLEHPAGSKLWKLMRLTKPGQGIDKHGGFSLSIDQHWFGHKCKKNTWLYIKGLSFSQIPDYTLNFNAIEYSISNTKNNSNLKEVERKWRNKTPIKLAKFLIKIVTIINSNTTKL